MTPPSQNAASDSADQVVSVQGEAAAVSGTILGLTIDPHTATVAPGGTFKFNPQGWVEGGGAPVVAPVIWTVTGGTISSDGLYQAGIQPGVYYVKAKLTTRWTEDSIRVTITGTAPTTTVSAITLLPAIVSLSLGGSQQFSASATLSDGSTQTNPAVSWTATGGTITTSGQYTAGNTAGSYRVIAQSSNGKADTSAVTIAAQTITGITVSPASVSLSTGGIQQFAASASLSNGSTQANPAVTWTATGGTITTSGRYTAGNTAGSYRVIAQSGNGRADTSAVTITAQTITAITLSPASVSLSTGGIQQFTASATLSNGSTQANPAVTWTATGGTIATSGRYTAGNTAGSYRVIAQSSNGKADTSAVTIAGLTITAITVSPTSVSLATAENRQFTASATMSNGSTQNNPPVTWSASGGSISSAGLYTAGGSAGSYQVIGQSSNGKADTAAVTVTGPTTPPPSGGGSYPNRPSNYTKVVTAYEFTEAPPTTGADQCFGSAGWCMIGGGTSVVRRLTDATAPNADKTVWEQTYGPGAGGGNAAGILYRNDAGVRGNKLYASMWVWYSPGFEWNTVSQKLLYWEDGNILLQQDHNGVPLSMYIGAPGYDKVYDPNVCAKPSLSAFEGKWHQIEWQVERGSPGLLRVWFDGTLCSDYRVNVPTISNSAEFNLNSTWGGGGTRTRTSYRRVDQIMVATP